MNTITIYIHILMSMAGRKHTGAIKTPSNYISHIYQGSRWLW